VPFGWVTADEAYGQAKWLQAWLEDQYVWYVAAIRCSDTLTTPEGEQRADDLIAALPSRSWQKFSAEAGAHGPREYHRARIPVRAGHKRRPKKGAGIGEPGLISYTLPEIRRLLVCSIQRYIPDPARIWAWSRWRRRCQYQARLCHYRQRGYVFTRVAAG